MFGLKKKTTIPDFSEYFPSIDGMSRDQLKFYKKLRKSLNHDSYVDVDGNLSYVFVYIYELLTKCGNKDFKKTYEKLIQLSETYSTETKISEYCIYWACDCLLAMNDLDGFLEKSEPKHPFGSSASQSDTRLSIQLYLKYEANIVDLVLLRNGRKNKLITEYEAEYRDFLYEANEEYTLKNGNWFTKLLDELGDSTRPYKHSLFSGSLASGSYKLDIDMYTFYTAKGVIHEIKNVTRTAENLLRDKLKIPRVGEGWISETRLYRYLSDYFSSTLVIHHGRPVWLERQHFDIWLPRWNVAVEYHGKQHFEPVEFFGGEEAFKKNTERDKRKINLSRRHGVKLFVVTEDDDFKDIALAIEKHISSKYFGSVRALC